MKYLYVTLQDYILHDNYICFHLVVTIQWTGLLPQKAKTELFSQVIIQLEQYYSRAISKVTVFSQGNVVSWAERYYIYN